MIKASKGFDVAGFKVTAELIKKFKNVKLPKSLTTIPLVFRK